MAEQFCVAAAHAFSSLPTAASAAPAASLLIWLGSDSFCCHFCGCGCGTSRQHEGCRQWCPAVPLSVSSDAHVCELAPTTFRLHMCSCLGATEAPIVRRGNRQTTFPRHDACWSRLHEARIAALSLHSGLTLTAYPDATKPPACFISRVVRTMEVLYL